jgi:polyisoprenoid-binding protein YceI
MKTRIAIVLMLAVAQSSAQDVHTQEQGQPHPVPIQGSVVNLSPANTTIGFIGTHEGPQPDPRRCGFAKFAGQAQLDETGTMKSVGFDIDTASLWAEIPKLTAHLKSPDFFDVRQHPQAAFRSTSITLGSQPGTFEVTGNFTLLGVTKEITAPASISVSEQGVTLVAAFTVDRTTFGMDYGQGKVKNIVEINVSIGEPTPDA